MPSDPQNSYQSNPNFLSRPLSARGWPKWLVYLIAGAGVVYLLNPGAGIFELIPDNIPLIGNLDEGAAAMVIWYGLLEFIEGRRRMKD